MIDVYHFLSLATELYGCRVRIFDCTKEEIVWDSKDYPNEDPVMESDFQGFGYYDVQSYDIYTDDGHPCIELNIEMDGEDDE